MVKEFYLKYRIYIIPSVVGFICLAIIIFVIIPQMMDFFKDKEKADLVLNRIELLNKKSSELESLDQTKLEQDLVTALTVLPTGRDVPQAMAVLQELVAKSNLTLKSTSYSSSAKTANQENFSFAISVAGSLPATRNFLNSLQDAARLFKVESIALKFQSGEGSLVADIPLSVYYQAAPSTVLTMDQPIAEITEKENTLIQSLSKYKIQSVAESSASSTPLGKVDLFQ
ncbi:MAG: type 4a pilus biogenesis protein PilO [Candidatus Daviesbacteria bacterium]|nr:type 4a pilus biogenesis protein PilO [Candidatus Daviesbacteria bacterium]